MIANDDKLAGEDLQNDVIRTEEQFEYYFAKTSGTKPVKSGGGLLHTVTVGGGAAGTLKIFDADNGTTGQFFELDSNSERKTYTLDVEFGNGLTLVLSAATNVTLSYR